jgi:hypothetical protein
MREFFQVDVQGHLYLFLVEDGMNTITQFTHHHEFWTETPVYEMNTNAADEDSSLLINERTGQSMSWTENPQLAHDTKAQQSFTIDSDGNVTPQGSATYLSAPIKENQKGHLADRKVFGESTIPEMWVPPAHGGATEEGEEDIQNPQKTATFSEDTEGGGSESEIVTSEVMRHRLELTKKASFAKREAKLQQSSIEAGKAVGEMTSNKERMMVSMQRCLLISFVSLLFCTWIYNEIEGWGFVDSIYFCVVSITTVGYGDLSPADDNGTVHSTRQQ